MRRGKRRALRLMILSACVLLCALWAESRMAPALAAAAVQEAHRSAAAGMAMAARDVIAASPAADYQQLMQVERGSDGEIRLISMDTVLVNTIISEVTLATEENLRDLEQGYLHLPLGMLTGSRLFSGMGPELAFRMRAQAAPTVTVEEEFLEAGVNQTLHSVYLRVQAEIRVLAPFVGESIVAESRLLLAEGVVVGAVPRTYVGLQP